MSRVSGRAMAACLFGLLLQAVSLTAHAAGVDLLRTRTVAPGDTLTVIVAVGDAGEFGVANLESLDVEVTFDAAALEFVSVVAGSAFLSPLCTTSVVPNDQGAGVLGVVLAVVCIDDSKPPKPVPLLTYDGDGLLVLQFRVAPGASPAADRSLDTVQIRVNEIGPVFDLAGPGVTDGDGDGINDVEELLNGLDPTDAGDGSLDPDMDGVSSRDELLAGSDPNDPDSVPGAPHVAGDAAGAWDAYTWSDDAAGANAPYAEQCAFTIGVDGVAASGECEGVDGTGETVPPGDLTLSLSDTGEVAFGGPFIGEPTFADAHMDIGRTAIAGMEASDAGGVPGDQALLLLIERGTGYRQADLGGTWHLFQLGDNAAPADDGSFWVRYVLRFSPDGALLPGSELYEDVAPATAVPVTGSGATLSPDGVVLATGDLAADATVLLERMDAGRTIIAGVARESFDSGMDIEDSLRVWLKQGDAYSQDDATGVWFAYLLNDAVGEQSPLVSKLTLVVDADGAVLVDGFSADGEVFSFAGTLAVSDAEGQEGRVTLGGELGGLFIHQHLRLDAGATVMAGVLDEDDAGVRRPGLLLAVKSLASAPRLVFPAPGSQLADTVARFGWTANGTPATGWRLLVGTAPGSGNLFDSRVLADDARSVTVGGLPADGRTLHVRLAFRVDGVAQTLDSTLQAADIVAPPPPSLVSPVAGSTFPGSAVGFAWQTNGTTVSRWQLRLGSTPGGSDLFSSPVLDASTLSLDVSGLPTDGRTIHARLRYDSGGFKDVDTTFQAADFPFPSITSPAAGQTLPGSEVEFEWSLFGQPVDDVQVWVGSAPGGRDLANSGSLGVVIDSFTATGLPVDGRAVYVRLRYLLARRWEYVDYGYVAADFPAPALTGPVGPTLAGSSVLFEWTDSGQPVVDAELWVGSRAGGRDLVFERRLGPDVNSVQAEGLPTDGRTVYVRLRTRVGRAWLTTDAEFTAADFPLPALTSPAPGSVLPGASATFAWSFNGQPVTDSELWVGTTFGGRQVLRARGLGPDDGSLQVDDLPTTGEAVYVQLRYLQFRRWQTVDYQYIAAGPAQPALTSPTPGSQLGGSTVAFQWSLNGLADVIDVEVRAGSRRGGTEYGSSGRRAPLLTDYTFDALPGDGSVVYVQLRYRVGRSTRILDYTFGAAELPAPALLNDTAVPFTGSSVLFEWTDSGQPVVDAELWVGSRAGGRDLVFERRLGPDVNSVQAEGLPTDGRTLYVRLRTRVGRAWLTTDAEFTAADFPLPALISPAPGSVLPGASATFAWSFNRQPVTDSELWVGTTFGGRQVLQARGLGAEDGSLQVDDLPTTGEAVYVQLRYLQFRRWQTVDYQYIAAGPAQPALTSPTPGSQLGGSSVEFQWSLNGLSDVIDVEVRAGSRRGGTEYGSSGRRAPLLTDYTFDALPGDGSVVYVQLRYRVGRSTRILDYTFGAAELPAPALTLPAGNVLPGSAYVFEWTDNGNAVVDAELWVGSRAGGRDLVFARRLGGDNSYPAEGLPTDGRTLYVRLRTRIGRTWLSADHELTAADFPLPELTFPGPGDVLTSSSATVEWSFNGHPVTDAELWVGTTPGKTQVVRARRLGGDTTSLEVTGIPEGVRNVYVRLRYQLLRRWQTVDYVVAVDVE